jgi:hypothetical protein
LGNLPEGSKVFNARHGRSIKGKGGTVCHDCHTITLSPLAELGKQGGSKKRSSLSFPAVPQNASWTVKSRTRKLYLAVVFTSFLLWLEGIAFTIFPSPAPQ